MRTLSAADILAVWERGEGLSDDDRSGMLLSMAEPGVTTDEWSDRTIGERNAGLLALRTGIFGNVAHGFAACPECRERVEMSFDASGMLEDQPAADDSFVYESAGYAVRFRLPTGSDLKRATAGTDMAEAFRILLSACILRATQNDREIAVDDLPASYQESLAEHIGSRDPRAETVFEMSCPSCSHQWAQPFDIEKFLWQEIAWHARRLLREVDELARAYGWTEPDILALSPRRRQAYLELVRL